MDSNSGGASSHYSNYLAWTTTVPHSGTSILSSISGHSLPTSSLPNSSQSLYAAQSPVSVQQQLHPSGLDTSTTSINSFYQDYNTQISNLKKKHLQEQQELEQRLLLQKQELERMLSQQSQYYAPAYSTAPVSSSAPSPSMTNSATQHMPMMDAMFLDQQQQYAKQMQQQSQQPAYDMGQYQLDSGSDPFGSSSLFNSHSQQQQQQNSTNLASSSGLYSSHPSNNNNNNQGNYASMYSSNLSSASQQQQQQQLQQVHHQQQHQFQQQQQQQQGSTYLEDAIAHQQQQQQSSNRNRHLSQQMTLGENEASGSSSTVTPSGTTTTGEGPSLIQTMAATSRHVSSVISHFTGTSDGYKRLAQELDGFLFILSVSGIIIFASNSCATYFNVENSSMLGQSIGIYLHPDDEASVMSKLLVAFNSRKSLSVFCRFKRFGTDPDRDSSGGTGRPMDSKERQQWEKTHQMLDTVLMEMTGRPVYEKGDPIPVFVVNVGREYRSKSTDEMDAILSLRLENIKLKLHLKAELEKRGLHAGLHSPIHGDSSASGQYPTPASSASSRSSSSAEPLTSQSSSHRLTSNTSQRSTSAGSNNSFEPTSSATYSSVSKGEASSSSSSLLLSFPPLNETSTSIGNLSMAPNSVNTAPSSARHNQKQSLSMDGSSSLTLTTPSVSNLAAKKRKKQRIPNDELVCRQCGTMASPEWRKGPDGPKTLCNACGLLYAKKVKIAKAAGHDIN